MAEEKENIYQTKKVTLATIGITAIPYGITLIGGDKLIEGCVIAGIGLVCLLAKYFLVETGKI